MKFQSVAVSLAVAVGGIGAMQACTVESTPEGSAGSAGQGAGGTSAAGSSAGGTTPVGTAGSAGTGTGTATCDNVAACGGPAAGVWTASSSCLKLSGGLDLAAAGLDPNSCTSATISGTLSVTGKFTANANGTYKDETMTTGNVQLELAKGCLVISGTTIDCKGAANAVEAAGYTGVMCNPSASGGCSCTAMVNQKGGMGIPNPVPGVDGNYTTAANVLTVTTDAGDKKYGYCGATGSLKISPQTGTATTITGSVAFQADGTGGMGGAGGGGGSGAGGTSAGAGGASGGMGGSSPIGGSGGSGGGGDGTKGERPCDVYAGGSTPCVAAYSMVRALKKDYAGPLFQVRSGSSAMNTGSGGMTKDIGQTADGYQDNAALEAYCMGTTCTVAKLYDQSGNGNDLIVAKKGLTNGGMYAGMDDFESSATKGAVMAGGHKVYPLYMAAREGYRTGLNVKGKNMPLNSAAQGIYEVADGTHYGSACCWDFGNVSPDPTKYGVMNTLFFGKAFWGNGAGSGPWFMADFEAGVWAGGSKVGDPGWGALSDQHPANPKNPSMAVPFAMGILKTQSSKWGLKSADVATAMDMTTSYEGAPPKTFNNEGGIVLGVGGDNSNNAWGTFFEGAIVAGYPTDAIDTAVLKNVKAVGYSK